MEIGFSSGKTNTILNKFFNFEQIVAVDSFTAHISTNDLWANLMRKKLVLISGNSDDKKIINTVEKFQPFDLIFVDGSHEYKDVKNDISVYSKFLSENGVLAVHDIHHNEYPGVNKAWNEFKIKNKTIILVTHALDIVKSWATRAIYLRNGEVVFVGSPAEAIKMYQTDVDSERQKEELSETHLPFSSFPKLESAATWGKITQVEGQTTESLCQMLELNPEQPGLRMVFDLCNVSIGEHLVFRLLNAEETVILFEQDASLNDPASESLSGAEHLFYHLECPDLSNLAQGEYHVRVLSQTPNRQEVTLLQFKLMIHHSENQRGLINLPFKIEVQNALPA